MSQQTGNLGLWGELKLLKPSPEGTCCINNGRDLSPSPKTPHPPSTASPPTSLLTPICGSKKYVPRPLPPVTLAEVELSCSLALHRPVSHRAEDPTHPGGFNRKRSALDPTMIFIYFYWDVVAVQGWICSRFIAKRLSYRYLCIYTPMFILFSPHRLFQIIA